MRSCLISVASYINRLKLCNLENTFSWGGGGKGGCSPRFPIAVHSNYLTHGSPHSLEALSVLTGHVTMYTRMYNVLNVVHVSVCSQSMVKGQRSRMCSRVTLSANVVCHVLELWLHCLNINQKWFS